MIDIKNSQIQALQGFALNININQLSKKLFNKFIIGFLILIN